MSNLTKCPKNVKNIYGQSFNRLIVIEYSHINKGKAFWRCQCACGNIKTCSSKSLLNGDNKSCGKCGKKHGDACKKRAPEYMVWRAIKVRCFNKNSKPYKWYGQRGITMCESWRNSYSNFLSDMGRRPSKGYSIDRINNNGNYEPGNCRWATAKDQANNRISSLRITYMNETLTAAQWCEKLNLVKYSTVIARIRTGIDPIKAITIPSIT